MSFRVEPAALDGYAGQAGRAGDDAVAVKRYLAGFDVPSGMPGGALIWAVGTAHADAMSAALGAAEKVSNTLRSSQAGLAEAARYYRTTDTTAAARLDATVLGRCPNPATPLEQAWAANPCAPSFWDSRNPTSRLTPVTDVEYSHPLAFMDTFSVSHWALQGFDWVFGFNPLDKLTETFAGDWQAIATAGVGIGRAGEGLQDVAYNVQGGAIALRGGWSGLAADAAYDHFTRLAGGVADLGDPLRAIAEQFARIAHGVWSTCEAIGGWIKGLLDRAIIAGVAAAAGTVTVETGVGAVVGYGVAALEVVDMLRLWALATDAISKIYGLVQGAVGLIEGQLSHLHDADLSDVSGYPAYRLPFTAAVGSR